MADKEARSFSIDADIKDELQHRSDLNASAIVNSYLREFLDATDTSEEDVIIREINKQIEDVNAEIEELEEKRERLVNRRERIKKRADEREEEALEDTLHRLNNVPPNPKNGFVVEAAQDLDMDPETLARQLAEFHNKEYQDPTGDNNFRSI
jgi:glutamyl-tRNA reductase